VKQHVRTGCKCTLRSNQGNSHKRLMYLLYILISKDNPGIWDNSRRRTTRQESLQKLAKSVLYMEPSHIQQLLHRRHRARSDQHGATYKPAVKSLCYAMSMLGTEIHRKNCLPCSVNGFSIACQQGKSQTIPAHQMWKGCHVI